VTNVKVYSRDLKMVTSTEISMHLDRACEADYHKGLLP